MTSITVTNVEVSIETALRERAARHGWSIEQEVLLILKNALASDDDSFGASGFAERVHRRFKGLGGDELALPPRQTARNVPDFINP